MEEFDVAVVGGGPAGCSAAREAARENNVVVFEKGVPREDRDGRGADSTDAAGFLDYWLEVADISPELFDEMPVPTGGRTSRIRRTDRRSDDA